MKKIVINIPTPCHQDWQKMTPKQQGKFCSSCQKVVADFTNMSDRALIDYFKKSQGSQCGRFTPEQLNRTIELPKKRMPWLRYFFTIAIPAFLISCKFSGRQSSKGEVAIRNEKLVGDTVAIEISEPLHTIGVIMPTMVEPTPVANEAKPVKQTMKRSRIEPIVNENEHFSLNPVEYHPVEIDSNISIVERKLSCSLQGVLGGYFIGEPIKKAEKSGSEKGRDKQPPIDAKKLSVFPNPVVAGGTIVLDLKDVEINGNCSVNIFSSSGASVQSEKMTFVNAASKMYIHLKTLAAGTYVINVIDVKRGKSHSAPFIVQ